MKMMVNIAMISFFAAILSSCTVVSGSTGQVGYVDDLYETVSREKINNEILRQQLAEERVERELQEAERSALGYESELVDSYEDSYERRLRGFSSSTYRMPSTYVNSLFVDIAWYTKIYDPAFYNIVISGASVWVEPKYITAMFGNWGTSVVIGTSWGSPYWSHWSSYCYNPWYYASYWWRPNHYHWAYHHPHYNYRPGYNKPHYPNYRPNRPSRPTTPIYYGNRRVSSLGNINTNVPNRRQDNLYIPNRSFSREIEANRNVNVVENSGYSTSELINRRRNNNKQNQPKVETKANNRNVMQNISNVINQGSNRNPGSSSGGTNRGSSSGGGVNRGRR